MVIGYIFFSGQRPHKTRTKEISFAQQGKDLFKTNTKPWAFVVFNDGFGYIKPNKNILFDNKGKVLIQNQELANSKELVEGKALQQKSYQDFLSR